jgi:hypothetical protein
MNRAPDDLRSRMLELVRRLVEASQVDTVYRDLYLRRARTAVLPAFPASEYARLKMVQPQIDRAIQESRIAVVRGDWHRVHELAERVSHLQRSLDAKREELALGADLYELERFPLDPFSPGFEGFVGGMSQAASALERVRRALEDLERLDPDGKDWYAARHAYFQKFAVTPAEWKADVEPVDAETAEFEALRALEQGRVDRVSALAVRMMSSLRTQPLPAGRAEESSLGFDRELAEPLPREVVARARELGLAYVELEAVPEVAEYLRRNAWCPTFSYRVQTEDGAMRVQATLGPEVERLPEGIRELITLFALHPYVNSGGARYLPRLRAQPVLFEDFPEHDEPPPSPLLAALGLGRRRALSRLEIEAALLECGADVLTDHLGLDPWWFRLLCIPFDIYARAGRDRGWGQREQWTHFDGYQLMRNGQVRALVGGDGRYGGLYDLASISPDDQRDGVIARFAIVRRKRLLSRTS